MTRLFALALVVTLIGCGGGRGATTSCAALATCCATGLPSGEQGACSQYASSTNESACAQALAAIQSASYCKEVSAAKGPTTTAKDGKSCDRYLSCVLAAEPEEYAAALQLYGSDSACWRNSAQTAGCNQACDASFADISSLCVCTGESCTACNAPTSGSYSVASTGQSQCTGAIEIESFNVNAAADGTASISVCTNDGSYMFTGALVCGGTSTFTAGDLDPNGCTEKLVLAITPSSAPHTFIAKLTATIWSNCTETGQTETCSQSTTISR